MIRSRREYSRGRGIKPDASYWCDYECDHDYPLLVTPTETGGYYARCLVCLTIGLQRTDSYAARKALVVLGANRDSIYEGGVGAI
jgi:hypothetical protein